MYKKRFVSLLSAVLVLLLSLTGCSGRSKQPQQEPEVHLAVILGSHDNAPPPNLELIADDVYEACSTFGTVTLVCDDGDPYHTVIDIPTQQKGLSESKYTSIAKEQARQILSCAQGMQAKTAEVDTLSAVHQAARSLSADAGDDNVSRKLIVLDSCLSTTGTLNFAQDVRLDSIDSQRVVDKLAQLDEIPDLKGVEVQVFTCGDVNGRQTRLTQRDRSSLIAIWESILKAGGADTDIKKDLALSTQSDERSLPPVTPVSVQESGVALSAQATQEALEAGAILDFPESTLSFEPGSAQLRDQAAAERALKNVIQYSASREDFELLICGTTACVKTERYCQELSCSRAESIKQMMVDNGLDSERIHTLGVGYDSIFYTYDLNEDGTLNEEVAPLNRTVKIMDWSCGTAQILNAAS